MSTAAAAPRPTSTATSRASSPRSPQRGETWSRPGLDPKIRSVVTLVIAATRSQWDEFRVHVRGAINNGLTRDELKEVLLHTAIHGGFPAARTGFKEAAAVLAEMEAEAGRAQR